MVEQRPDALEEVAGQQSGSTAALWARQAAGDMELATGVIRCCIEIEKRLGKSLKDAEKQFLAVEQDGARYPMLLQRARYGLAQVYESLCVLDKARDYYKKFRLQSRIGVGSVGPTPARPDRRSGDGALVHLVRETRAQAASRRNAGRRERAVLRLPIWESCRAARSVVPRQRRSKDLDRS